MLCDVMASLCPTDREAASDAPPGDAPPRGRWARAPRGMCMYKHMCVHIYIYIYIYIQCVHIHTYVCMYVCMYIYIYIYIHNGGRDSEVTRTSTLEGVPPLVVYKSYGFRSPK